MVLDHEAGDGNGRVMYEDPAQRDEKMRLIGLFGTEPGLSGEDGSGGGGSVRRSTRIAGF
jgi:hypothetical protein